VAYAVFRAQSIHKAGHNGADRKKALKGVGEAG
jgi:hypothetical protein